ncbi:MAG: tail fiber assembly protein [Kluyvera sp.]
MNEFDNQVATWGSDGWAECSGWAKAYCADHITGEYIGVREVWVSAGTGLPAGAYIDEPPSSIDGKAVVRSSGLWEHVNDYRGLTCYDTSTLKPSTISSLGPVPEGFTIIAPTSKYDVWSGSDWVRDSDAENKAALDYAKSEQSSRIEISGKQISILKPAVDGGYAKPDHKNLLSDWQRYQYEVTQVSSLPGWPINPEWPHEPEKVV